MISEDFELAEYLSALANPSRLAVLRTLGEGEVSVKELARRVGLSQSSLSQHLSVLRRHHLVQTRREATTIFYSLARQRSEKALCLFNEILFPQGLDILSSGLTDLLHPRLEMNPV